MKHYYALNMEIKSNYAEIFQKFLKTAIYRSLTKRKSNRWIDVLQPIVHNYNNSYHSTIKTTPASVSKGGALEETIWRNQYEKQAPPKPDGEFKIKVGDLVRLSHVAKVFSRNYDEKWTRELFSVSSARKRASLNVYEVKDLNKDPILGTFYEKELQPVTFDLDGPFDVERVLRTKHGKKGKKMLLIRWANYPPSFDSWISEDDIV